MADLSKNPLINPPKLPNDAPSLDIVRTEHYLPALKAAIAKAKAEIEAIKSNTDAPSFANTVEALEFTGSALDRTSLVFSNIALANTNKDIQKIEPKIDIELTRHGSDIMLDEELFARIKVVYDQKDALNLDPRQARLLEKTYKGFLHSGALLDAKGKAELRQINERLAELSTQFNQNEVKATDAFIKVIDNEDELKGVPDRAKADYAASAKREGKPGKWVIKLSPPPSDIMAYAESRALREEIYRAQFEGTSQGEFDNGPLILEIIKLRQREAELIGFKNYADLALDNRMAKNSETVLSFLERNAQTYRPAAEAYLKKIKDFAQKRDGVADFQPWDYSFYSRLLKEETFKMKMEDFRPYFELENVLKGLEMHVEKLFGIKMNQQPAGKYPVYHEDVKVYEVNDTKTGELLAVFYADFYARPGAKSSGAWAYKFRGRGLQDGVDQIPLVVNVCNFSKPVPETTGPNGEKIPGRPSLLSFGDVTTIFHEFGHGMHTLLARGPYGSLNGTAVKRDFVEVPSQLQENWVSEKEVLRTFARHHQTGQPMSDEMIDKLNDLQNFDAAYAGLRQTFLALLDMTWHSVDPATVSRVEDVEDAVVAKASLFPRVTGPMSNVFGHIFAGGYSAGYYGYKWAEEMDADIFETFKKKGLYDQELAQLLRTTIYEQGDNEDPASLFMQLMGRGPDAAALFRREGLTPPPKGGQGPRPPAP